MRTAVPSWCEHRAGASSVIVVAPHGGRRARVDPLHPPRDLRVNDLYTPEVALELAHVLDAGVLINHGQDRNVLDLNRTSQVVRHAPWFLDLLRRSIEAVLERHERAEVLFVHGWHIGQLRCDVGFGAVETSDGLRLRGNAKLSVPDDYIGARISRLRAACARHGIEVSIGARYAASSGDNVVQMFTERALAAEDGAQRRLAALAVAGRVAAVQLELSAPLRWPGPWRDRFLAEMGAVFGAECPTGSTRRAVSHDGGDAVVSAAKDLPRREQAAPQAPRLSPVFLQFYDPRCDLGLFSGVGPVGPNRLGGRLLLFLGGQRVALFTGESGSGGAARGVPPLAFSRDAGGVTLDFEGPMLALDDGDKYVDLEAALAESHLVVARLHARLTATPAGSDLAPGAGPTGAGDGICFGPLVGELELDECGWQIDTRGFAGRSLRTSGSGRQTTLVASFDDGVGFFSQGADSGGFGLRFDARSAALLEDVRVVASADGDPYTPSAFRLDYRGESSIGATPRSRMSILRPAASGGYVRVTFGAARFARDETTGYGLFEHAEPVGPISGAPRRGGGRADHSPGTS